MSDGYRPFIQPVEGRDEWVRTANYKQLREALAWTLDAKAAAEDEYHVFASALTDALEAKANPICPLHGVLLPHDWNDGTAYVCRGVER